MIDESIDSIDKTIYESMIGYLGQEEMNKIVIVAVLPDKMSDVNSFDNLRILYYMTPERYTDYYYFAKGKLSGDMTPGTYGIAIGGKVTQWK